MRATINQQFWQEHGSNQSAELFNRSLDIQEDSANTLNISEDNMSGDHRGFYDPNDLEVEVITPKIYARRNRIDIHKHNFIYMKLRNQEGSYMVVLDFVETPFGMRPYFQCPNCKTRRQKLFRPPNYAVFACNQCWRASDVMRYACNLRKGEHAWETFAKEAHRANRYEKMLCQKPRPRGSRRRRIEGLLLKHLNAAEDGREKYIFELLRKAAAIDDDAAFL